MLLVLPDRNARDHILNQSDLVRLLGLLLDPSGFHVESGRPLTRISFPEQVDEARNRAERSGAGVVVWYGTNSVGGSSELFLHLLDLLTDKTLVRTIRVSGTTDLERTAALKVWALLRASLLEMRADTEPSKLPGPVAALTKPAKQAAGRSRKVSTTPAQSGKIRPSRLSLSLFYEMGLFVSGQGFHHGAGICVDVILKQWSHGLSFTSGLALELPGKIDSSLADASLQAHLLPVAATLSLRWTNRSWFLLPALRAGIIVLTASAQLPERDSIHVTKVDPFTGFGFDLGWKPTRNTALILRTAADAVWLGQCFERSSETLCLDRARFSAGLGFRMDI